MASPVPRRKRRKVKSAEESDDDGEEKPVKTANEAADTDDDSQDDQPIQAMKEAEAKTSERSETGDKSSEKDAKANGESYSIFTDVQYWKDEREKLDGSFMAARALFMRHGPWNVPGVDTERKFRLIAKSTVVKMDR